MLVLLNFLVVELCAFIPCAIFLYYTKYTRQQILMLVGFVLYLAAVLWICGIGTVWDIKEGNEVIRINATIAPRQLLHRAWWLNVLLFVPLGCLLPYEFQGFEQLRSVLCFACLFSCAIEFSQLFCMRTTDINDVCANTIGGLVGYALYVLLLRKHAHKDRALHRDAFALAVMAFAGVFFMRVDSSHPEMRVVEFLDR